MTGTASSPPDRAECRGRSTAMWWCLCVVVFSGVYLATCQRGVSWQDSGMFQRRVLEGDYTGTLGLALAHPLYIAAGRAVMAVPVGTFAGRLNFFSGLGMAVALANLAGVVALLTGRRWPGLAVAAMLAVAHTVWWLSTIAEVYTWSVAGLTCELWLLAILVRRSRWWVLAALAFVSGLGWCMHNFALLPMPVYAIVAIVLVRRGRLPAWSLAVAAGAFCLGAGPYLDMIAHESAATGSLGQAIGSALVGRYAEQVLNVASPSPQAGPNAVLMAMNFASLLVPLAVVGWFRLRRVAGGLLAGALGAVTVIHVVFVARYNVHDQFTFLLPSLALTALAAGVGLAELADRSRRWRIASIAACVVSVVLAPVFYGAAPAIGRAAGVQLSERQPFRDELRYWLVPWKHNEDSAERFAKAALKQAGPNGIILTDSTADEPILLVQRRDGVSPRVVVRLLERDMPSYEVDPAAFRSALGGRPLYLSRPPTGRLAAEGKFTRGPDEALFHEKHPQ